jgi:hypothetical protein
MNVQRIIFKKLDITLALSNYCAIIVRYCVNVVCSFEARGCDTPGSIAIASEPTEHSGRAGFPVELA